MAYTTPYYNASLNRRAIPKQQSAMARPEDSMRATPSSTQADGNDYLKDIDWGQVGGGVTAGLSGYAQGQAGVQDFSIDPYAGLKGSGQGFAQGGWIGAVVGGISAQVGQFSELNKRIKNIKNHDSSDNY